jgi:LacI family transcriptional regulator
MSFMPKPFRIALTFSPDTIEEWRPYHYAAHRFAQSKPDWQIVRVRGFHSLTWDDAIAAEPDAILGTLQVADPLPVVDTSKTRVLIVNASVANHPYRRFMIDGIEAGRRATRHLISRNLASYVYFGWSDVGYSEEHRLGFEEAISKAGLNHIAHSIDMLKLDTHESLPDKHMLLSLPKPCGIVCVNDGLAVRIIESCLNHGLLVPEDVAVMGLDEDPTQSVRSQVPLSSVARDLFNQCLAASEYLDKWLRNLPVPDSPVLYPPGEVIERQSTMIFGVDDPLVRQALTIIHTPESTLATVEHLLDLMQCDVSRRQVEKRFRKALGHTPYQEIQRARVAYAQKLLRSTNYSIDDIAYHIGLPSSVHISRLFKAHTGMTPTAYRKQAVQ